MGAVNSAEFCLSDVGAQTDFSPVKRKEPKTKEELAIESRNTSVIDNMLASLFTQLPPYVQIHPKILESFNRVGPLTYNHFIQVAEENGVMKPCIDDG